jgi:hypothetical protein
MSEKSLDARARRAARRVGLVARKSRRRIGTADNLGGYMLLHAIRNYCVRGSRLELSAEEVIEFCESQRDNVAA